MVSRFIIIYKHLHPLLRKWFLSALIVLVVSSSCVYFIDRHTLERDSLLVPVFYISNTLLQIAYINLVLFAGFFAKPIVGNKFKN